MLQARIQATFVTLFTLCSGNESDIGDLKENFDVNLRVAHEESVLNIRLRIITVKIISAFLTLYVSITVLHSSLNVQRLRVNIWNSLPVDTDFSSLSCFIRQINRMVFSSLDVLSVAFNAVFTLSRLSFQPIVLLHSIIVYWHHPVVVCLSVTLLGEWICECVQIRKSEIRFFRSSRSWA